MYQFPLIETDQPTSFEELLFSSKWFAMMGKLTHTIQSVHPIKIHLLTHQRLHIRFISIALEKSHVPEHWHSVELNESERYAVPKPIEQFLQELGQ
jgi:A/G-specific adenine glycosylase